jgi:hypothetical protein
VAAIDVTYARKKLYAVLPPLKYSGVVSAAKERLPPLEVAGP